MANINLPPLLMYFFSLFTISSLKFQGNTIKASGFISLAFCSDINSISEPKHFRPTLSGFLSLMYGILFLFKPKCCKRIFPFVLAPKARTFFFELIISSTNLFVLFFILVIIFW